jgi:hypothetical protein
MRRLFLQDQDSLRDFVSLPPAPAQHASESAHKTGMRKEKDHESRAEPNCGKISRQDQRHDVPCDVRQADRHEDPRHTWTGTQVQVCPKSNGLRRRRQTASASPRRSSTPSRLWRSRRSVRSMKSWGRRRAGSPSVWRCLIFWRGRICWRRKRNKLCEQWSPGGKPRGLLA